MNPKDELLTTRGITSEVREDGTVIGHALLTDYDSGSAYNRLREETAALPGVSFLFRSSPGSWHYWNTTVSDTDGAALRMLSLKCDPMHISVGYRRGRWTLRFGAKNRINASPGYDEQDAEYKTPPEPMDWWVNKSDEPQSRPHLNVAAARFEDAMSGEYDAIRAKAFQRCPEWRGNEYRAESYFTMTDDLKAEL